MGGLAREVLDYEIWRLGEGACLDPEALLFHAPYKAGQVTASGIVGGIAEEAATAEALLAAARRRPDYAGLDPDDLDARVREAFRQGVRESHIDWYHLARAAWRRP